MAIFRYFLDYGSGWVEVNPVDNDLVWSNENDINPAITRVRLTGNITFIGDEYDDITTYRDAGNLYIDIKAEQLNGTWQIIFEGNADLRKPYDNNQKSITFDKFNNVNDYYDNIISNYDIKYGLKDLSLTNYAIYTPPSMISITEDAQKTLTGLTPAQYILAYDVNGFPSLNPAVAEARWAYFLFRSTDGTGHNFETMSFDKEPDATYGYTPIQMIVGSRYVTRWVKLPPSVGASETINWAIAFTFNRFPEVINVLIGIASNTVTFTESTAVSYTGQSYSGTPYSWFTFANYQIGEVAEIAQQGFKGSEISLKDCFNIMENAFNLFWYIDGTVLKFKHPSEFTTSGTLDLSNESEYLQQIIYKNIEIPDMEKFFTNDAESIYNDPTPGDNPWGQLQIYYRNSNNVLTNNIEKENKIKIGTNVTAMLAGLTNTEKNQFAFIETTDNTSSPRIVYGSTTSLNTRLSTVSLFGHLNKWRFGKPANFANGLKILWVPLGEIEPKPLQEVAIIDYHIDLLTDYDMINEIITAIVNGKTKRISQRLSTDYAQIEVEF